MTDSSTTSKAVRRLAAALEPFTGQVYFSPECHAEYEKLGFGPSPAEFGGVQMPDGPAYFCSRGSCLGQVPGELVAAAFAVFNPAVVLLAVAHGWTLTDSETIEAARTRGAVAQLERILGPAPEGVDRVAELLRRAGGPLRPEGRPLYAGMLARDLPDGALGTAWRLGDRLREYRGDSHTAAWTSAGLDATEIGLMSELYWGLPLRTYIRTRAWSDADLDAAEERLVARGLLERGSLTPSGREVRERVELSTDNQCAPMAIALGEELDELLSTLEPWGVAIRAAGGYPSRGPHDLAEAAATR